METRRASSPPPPDAPVPQVRASHPQGILRIARETLPAESAAILAAIRPETHATLAAAAPLDWIPAAIDVEVIEAITVALEPAPRDALLAARQREEVGSTLLSGFVQTALRAFAPSPANLVKQLPAGWGRVFRDAGWIAIISTGRHDAVTRFHRLPPVCTGSAAWMASLSVSFQALYDLVGVTGTVDCRIEDAAQGVVLVTWRWK
jgi:hypothetical protein